MSATAPTVQSAAPRSVPARRRSPLTTLLIGGFVGTHLPLIALLVFSLVAGSELDRGLVLLTVLGATLTGTGLVFGLVRHVLSPVLTLARALAAYRDGAAAFVVPSSVRDGDDVGRLAQDIAALVRERERSDRTTAENAGRDPLTGLPSRAAARDLLTSAMRDGAPLCLVTLRVSGLADLNETRGFAAGDAALTAAGAYLNSAAGPDAWAARWSGGRFLLCVRAATEEQARSLADRLCLAPPPATARDTPTLPLAVEGPVTARRAGETPDSLLLRATTSSSVAA